MHDGDSPKDDAEAVTDAAFEEGPLALPRRRAPVRDPGQQPPALPEEGPIGDPPQEERPAAPFQDYVRELQEEFEEQEDEGKL
jgi:hypothetical protein